MQSPQDEVPLPYSYPPIDPFVPSAPFLDPLKTSENLPVF